MKNLKITCQPFIMAMFIVLNTFASVQAMDYVSDIIHRTSKLYSKVENVLGRKITIGVGVGFSAWLLERTLQRYPYSHTARFIQELEGFTKLFDAVSQGDLIGLTWLVEGEGLDIKTTYERNEPILYPNNWHYYNLLHYAVRYEYKNIIEYLLTQGWDINASNSSKETALHVAALRGQYDMAVYLLHKGANVNAVDSVGQDPLKTAIMYGRLDVVRLFIEQEKVAVKDGVKLVFWALSYQQFDIAKYLIKQLGIDFNTKNRSDERNLLYYITHAPDILKRCIDEFDINAIAPFADGSTRLHDTVEAWTYAFVPSFDYIKSIVEHGGDVTFKDANNITPYDIAALKNPNSELTKYLCNAKNYQELGTVVTSDNPVEEQNLSVIPNYFSMALYSGQLGELKRIYTHKTMLKKPEWLCLLKYIKDIERSVVPLREEKIVALKALHELNLEYGTDDEKLKSRSSQRGHGVYVIQMMLRNKGKNNLISDMKFSFQ